MISDVTLKFREALFQQYLHRSRGVMHLGAHLAQEAELYAKQGKSVVWIEALPHIHARLQKRIAPFSGQTALCALLDDTDTGERIFHISNNGEGVSSSIFPFGEYAHGANSLWPDLALSMIGQLTLPSIQLDTLLSRAGIDASDYDFWIVDLQGAELNALKGGLRSLAQCRSVYVEISTVEVYRGGVMWNELSAWLIEQGLTPLWEPAQPHDDVLFVRRDTRDVMNTFHSDGYQRHNARRLEHLALLGLDLHHKSVLEVGAGVGDHTEFFLNRHCRVMTTDARPENVAILERRFTGNGAVKVRQLDMDHPQAIDRKFQLIHCYGLLYHLEHPAEALAYLANCCEGQLLLETCVSRNDDLERNPVAEPAHDFSQAMYGTGCRPGRKWIWDRLKNLFPFVYATRTQPDHEEFPIDWGATSGQPQELSRMVFVASTVRLVSAALTDELPIRQLRLTQ